jgi:hypothetical protein
MFFRNFINFCITHLYLFAVPLLPIQDTPTFRCCTHGLSPNHVSQLIPITFNHNLFDRIQSPLFRSTTQSFSVFHSFTSYCGLGYIVVDSPDAIPVAHFQLSYLFFNSIVRPFVRYSHPQYSSAGVKETNLCVYFSPTNI